MLHKKALGDPGLFEEIFEMGVADHGIQINSSRIVFGKKHAVMRSQPLYYVRIAVAQIIDLLKGIRPSLFEHGEEFPEDPRSALRVVYCAVMVFQTYSHYFGNCVQCIFGVSGKDRSGYSQSIHRSEGAVSSLLPAVLPDKTDIKSNIVANQYAPFRKR